jgi:cellobiose phosphorylase
MSKQDALNNMMRITARDRLKDPIEKAREIFADLLNTHKINDALFVDSGFQNLVAVAGLPVSIPCVVNLFMHSEVESFLNTLIQDAYSLLLFYRENSFFLYKADDKAAISQVKLADSLKQAISDSVHYLHTGAGFLNEQGEHCMHLTAPNPGPHFAMNLLLGNRLECDHPLQTTPKSVVDRLGGGSFRSHAFTQVLAIRWDLRQEENGFPANRQFYLVEEGRLIFYSREPEAPNIKSAWCRHSQNFTEITYSTKCGLEIIRTIMLLQHKKEHPIATEVQHITIKNHGKKKRSLRIVYTGMFGTHVPHAMMEDVLYSNIIMQSEILKNTDGSVLALTHDYHPHYLKDDLRFNTMIVYDDSGVRFPREFCTDYNDFVGNGSLSAPDALNRLPNRIARKGPGFFAYALPVHVAPAKSAYTVNFTGLVSSVGNPGFSELTTRKEIENLVTEFTSRSSFSAHLEKNWKFLEQFARYLHITSDDNNLQAFVNNNLPFQILYQTFVSRSFAQTQKGYREIGFREIQDLYASMYYFTAMGKALFVRQAILTWSEHVYDFGYTNHNFFWKGKEPGRWSDDGLWLIEAVYRYVELTGDINFVDTPCKIADKEKSRPLYETLKSIIHYSSSISVGGHGFPLLDFADWNDCLKVDADPLTGAEKEELYKKDPEKAKAVLAQYTESVMNAFLLKSAIDHMQHLAEQKKHSIDSRLFKKQSADVKSIIHQHAWKKDFYARLLFNRYQEKDCFFLGAQGDGLSLNPHINGSYYLNSFSWAVLSDCADDEQIRIMLDSIDTYLKTPHGYKLCTEVNLQKINPRVAVGEYFPGDRENAGIFKHACMMAVNAMFKAAKQVTDIDLAARLTDNAYWMLEKVLPYKTMENPYTLKGNPRFCTQYINSDTGEHIGPMLSGTAPWLALSLFESLGIEYRQQGIICDPVLRKDDELVSYELKTQEAAYHISIKKPKGFYRYKDHKPRVILDGKQIRGNTIPLFTDGKKHTLVMDFLSKS